MTGNASVEGTSRFETQKPGKRQRGDAPSPEPSADPVAYFPLAGFHEAYDVASHLVLEEYAVFLTTDLSSRILFQCAMNESLSLEGKPAM